MHRLAMLVARQSKIRKIAMSTPVIREIAWQFVAGDDLASGLEAVRVLNGRGIKGSLNFFGMHVHDEREAMAAADEIIESLNRIHTQRIDSHVSVKLTKIGLDIDASFCRAQLTRILDCAAEAGVFVRIDMEESPYVEHTLRLFDEMLDRYGEETVGTVIQSYLRNRTDDLERLIARGARIRLVKGGYFERAEVASRDRAEIDAWFLRDIELLLRRGRQPAIATHDSEAIRHARAIQEAIGSGQGGVRVPDALRHSTRTAVRSCSRWVCSPVLRSLRRTLGGLRSWVSSSDPGRSDSANERPRPHTPLRLCDDCEPDQGRAREIAAPPRSQIRRGAIAVDEVDTLESTIDPTRLAATPYPSRFPESRGLMTEGPPSRRLPALMGLVHLHRRPRGRRPTARPSAHGPRLGIGTPAKCPPWPRHPDGERPARLSSPESAHPATGSSCPRTRRPA